MWKDVVGFEGRYLVSNMGAIFSTFSNREILQYVRSGKRGYPTVKLYRDGSKKTMPVHRLVLEAFVGKRLDGYECAHINGIKTDNRLENLTWSTPRENNGMKEAHGTLLTKERHPMAKLTNKNVDRIRVLISEKIPYSKIAKEYEVSKSTIGFIAVGKCWRKNATRK